MIELDVNSLPIGEWHHVALSVDGDGARLYVNGSEAR